MMSQIPIPADTGSLLVSAREARRRAEETERAAVTQARVEGWSWDRIGDALEIPGETLRRRYAVPTPREAPEQAQDAPESPAPVATTRDRRAARRERTRRGAARVRVPGRSLGVQVVLFSEPKPPRLK